MPTRPRLKSTTISLSPQLRTDLQRIADRKLIPVAAIVREACLLFVEVERERAQEKLRAAK